MYTAADPFKIKKIHQIIVTFRQYFSIGFAKGESARLLSEMQAKRKHMFGPIKRVEAKVKRKIALIAAG